MRVDSSPNNLSHASEYAHTHPSSTHPPAPPKATKWCNVQCSLRRLHQAIRQHEFVELLDDPGSADLSAYVDFGALRQAVHQAVADSTAQQLKGGLKDVPSVAQCYGPITQNQLLHAMGIHLRAQALAEVRRRRLGQEERSGTYCERSISTTYGVKHSF
jgi:hypothetical protein